MRIGLPIVNGLNRCYMNLKKPVNIVRVNIESNRKVADAYEIEIAPSFVLQRKGKMLWEKTGEVFPGELRDVIEMFKN